MPTPSRHLLALASFLFCAAPIAAQTIVVDAAGGAGSQFTSIAAATAQAPDGAVLVVRAGTYEPFTIDGKGLSILCDPSTDILAVAAPAVCITIQNTSPIQPVIVRGANLLGPGGVLTTRCSQCQGSVLLEDLTSLAGDSLGLNTNAGERLLINRCGPFRAASGGIDIQTRYTAMNDCDVVSGPLQGLRFTGEHLMLNDCSVQGGSAQLSTSAIASSGTLVLSGGTSVVGGSAGSTAAAITGPGSIVIDPSCTVTGSTATTPVTRAQAALTATGGIIGTAATATLTVPANGIGGLVIADLGITVTIPGFENPVWLNGGSMTPVAMGAGPSITANVPIPSLPVLRGQPFIFQGIAYEPGRSFFWSNPAPLIP